MSFQECNLQKPRLQSINFKEWKQMSLDEQANLFEELKQNKTAHRRQPVSPNLDKLIGK